MAKDIRDLADEEVMQLVQGGNHAFELLYDRHGGAASRSPTGWWAMGAAEDIVQRRSFRSGTVACATTRHGEASAPGCSASSTTGRSTPCGERRAPPPARDDRGVEERQEARAHGRGGRAP